MPRLSNGVALFHVGEVTRDDSPQIGKITWHHEGEEPHATQDAMVCRRIDWEEMTKHDASLLAWATVGLRAGLLLAVSPENLLFRLGATAESGLLGL
jgi:hypothetical protein